MSAKNGRGQHYPECNPGCNETGHLLLSETAEGDTPRMVVTDCCGQLLPESQTLVGDAHFSDLCLACQALDGSEHERHVTCDWSHGVECPGRDWSYIDGRVTSPAAACEDHDGCGWCPTHDCAAAACAHEHAQTSVTPPGQISTRGLDTSQPTSDTAPVSGVTP